jgi:hypothetical protein
MPWDPKIRAVTDALGPAGLGGLAALWCHIARHGRDPGRAINSRGQPLSVDELQAASLLPGPDFRVLVDICVSTGHFQREPWERSREIRIPAMSRRADEYTKKRERRKQQRLVFDR